jgi:surfeit locus 1 family protein
MDSTASTKSRLSWHSDWRTSLFVILLTPLFVGLGLWQLQRAEEKLVIAEQWQLRQQESPRSLESLSGEAQALAYRRVRLQGEFVPGRAVLLDNRMYQGRYGLEVLSPFQLQGSGRLVLVNRGWVLGDGSRRSLPTVLDIAGPQSITGTVYVPPGEAYSLGDPQAVAGWPKMVQVLDIAYVEELLEQPLYPYSVRLDADSAGALTTNWPLLNVSADKHQAYAVQWFSMALVLFLIYIWRSSNIGTVLQQRRRSTRDSNQQ